MTLRVLFVTIAWISSGTLMMGQLASNYSSQPTVNARYLSKFSGPTCRQRDSCKGKCTERTQYELGEEPMCHCDPLCTKFTDCCADYVRMCKPKAQESVVPVALNMTANPTPVPPNPEAELQFRCVTFEISNNRPGVWMVTSCSRDWPVDETYQRCTSASRHVFSYRTNSVLDDVPLIDLTTGITYRNRYCGECNHISKDKTSFWQVLSRCHIKPPSSLVGEAFSEFVLRRCIEVYSLPRVFQKRRYCYPVSLNCSSHSNNTAQLDACTHGNFGLVYVRGQAKKYFKNHHCLACSGFSRDDAICGPAEFPNPVGKPRSFKILMDFLPDKGKTVSTTKVVQQCRNGNVYDRYLEICRKGVLPEPSQALFDKYRMKLWMSSSSSMNVIVDFDDFLDAFTGLFALNSQQVNLIHIKREELSMVVLLDLSSNGATAGLNSSVREETAPSLHTLLNFNSTFELIIGNVTWSVFKVTKRRLSCTRPRTYQPDEYDEVKRANNERQVVIKKTKQTFGQQDYYFIKEDRPGGMLRATVFVCESVFSVACPGALILLNKEEYVMLPSKTVLRNVSGEMFTQGNYDIENTSAWVCAKLPPQQVERDRIELEEDPVLWYLNVIGLTLSLISLVIVLITHGLFKELRSLPGQNLMNLCTSLFMAHLLWLLTSGATASPSSCRTAAIFLHYFFLVTFFCMMIIAHDTKRTFSRTATRVSGLTRGSSTTARFACYCGVAWAFPAVFVGTCAILDQQNVVAMGYGSEVVCWITNQRSLLLFFAAPIGSVMLYNSMAFVHSVWAIRSTRRKSRQANSQVHHQPKQIYIYLRLLTLMGFAWVFGFGATLIHSLLAYPFVILTSSHGVYLAAAFVFKPRILLMYKRLLSNRRTQRGLQTTRATTTTTPECRSSTSPARRGQECDVASSRL